MKAVIRPHQSGSFPLRIGDTIKELTHQTVHHEIKGGTTSTTLRAIAPQIGVPDITVVVMEGIFFVQIYFGYQISLWQKDQIYMTNISREAKLRPFPFERTAEGRQRTLMGLSVRDFYQQTEIRLNSSQNVSFFTEEHWEARLKWRRETLSGRLKQLGLRISDLMNKQTKGQLLSLQLQRDRLRFR